MAETLSHDKRAVFDYLTPIIDLSTVTRSMALLSLEVQRETNSRSSWEREAILSLHDMYTVSAVMGIAILDCGHNCGYNVTNRMYLHWFT